MGTGSDLLANGMNPSWTTILDGLPTVGGNNIWAGTNTFDGSVTVNAPATFNASVAFNGPAVFNDPTTFVDWPIFPYTPQAYGAVGDGVTDDTVAIQAAVTAAQGTGGSGIVIFPPTVGYKITTSINCATGAKPVALIGFGGISSQIISAIAAGAATFSFDHGSTPFSDAGLVQGLYFPAPTSPTSGNVAVYCNNANNIIVKDCTILGYNIGLYYTLSFAPIIITNKILNCVKEAIYFSDNSGNGSNISGNTLRSNGAASSSPAIALGSGTTLTTGPYIAGNTIEGNYGGILIAGTIGFLLGGNDFDNNTNYHIFFGAGTIEGVDIRGNFFGACAAVTFSNVTGVTFEKNALFNHTISWASSATLVKVGYNALTGSSKVGSGVNTFSTFPAPSALLEGQGYPVSDSPVSTYGTTVTIGGGSSHVFLYCNGSAWVVG